MKNQIFFELSQLSKVFEDFANKAGNGKSIIKGYDTTSNGLGNFIVPRNGIIPGEKLLVLGLNPSVITSHNQEVPFCQALQQEDIRHAASSDADLQQGMVGGINYFTMLNRIAEALGIESYSYADVLKLRKTDSSDVKSAIAKYYGNDSGFTQFVDRQLELLLAQIKQAAPSVILVNNSLAASMLPVDGFFFGEPAKELEPIRKKLASMGVSLTLDAATDSYIFRIGEELECRCFLSEMCTVSMGNHAIGRLVKDMKQFL